MDQTQSPVKMDPDGTSVLDASGGKNTITVHSSGEMCSLPDVIQFTVTIRSSKETVEDAQASVKRRTDYVSQVIRKNGVKNNDVTLSTEISKGGGAGTVIQREGQAMVDMATVYTDVVVKCDSWSRCETIRNLLIEKMDSSVQFSPVSFWHSTEAKQGGR